MAEGQSEQTGSYPCAVCSEKEALEAIRKDMRDVKVCLMGDMTHPENGKGLIAEVRNIRTWVHSRQWFERKIFAAVIAALAGAVAALVIAAT